MTNFINDRLIQRIQNASCYRIVAKECEDDKGKFWRGVVVFGQPSSEHIVTRCHFVAVDSLDELKVFCDLHMMKIDNVEHLNGK